MTRFTVVPHTHWDREWYRPFEHFRLELARTVDGILDTLENDPDFTSFTLDGQAIVLEDYVDLRPENEARLRALIKANRLETGPSYVLPDEFLVGAESLVRNLLIGRLVCARFGATPTPVGYLPDSFGHPLQLPQILKGFGIESLIFSRGMGDQLDQVGLIFRWLAPDGSAVLAIQQQGDYGNFAAIQDIDDAQRRARAVERRFGPIMRRAGVDEVLLCNGTDHLPIQPEMPALCRELEQRNPGSTFELGTYAGYVERATPEAPPSWSGELLGSRLHNVLRGVNSARLYLKRANERAERRLLAVETLAALSSLQTKSQFPGSDFRLAWRELLKNQPHDSICGCSCDEVHRDMMVRYEQLHRMLDVLQERALTPFMSGAGGEHRVSVLNPLPYRRTGVVELPGRAPMLAELEPFAATTVELEPFAATTIELPPQATRPPATAVRSIENDELKIEAADDGTLTLTDKRSGRRFPGLHGLEDEPDVGDLYNFCPVEGAVVWRSQTATASVRAAGPVVWELETRTQTEGLAITTVVRLTKGSRRIEFRTTLENHKTDHRLRATFPVPGTKDEHTVRAEGQFAIVERSITATPPKTDWVEPPDPTQHTLGAVAAGPLALLTKGLPEYEARPYPHEARPDAHEARHELCLTLVRSVGLISQPSDAITTRPLGAGPQTPTPEGQCLGRHHLEYALLLDADELDDAALIRASQDYCYGFVTTGSIDGWDPPLTVDSHSCVFSCLKGAEDGDGLILRCFNPTEHGSTLRLRGPFTTSRAQLDERAADGDLTLRPGEIASFRLHTS